MIDEDRQWSDLHALAKRVGEDLAHKDNDPEFKSRARVAVERAILDKGATIATHAFLSGIREVIESFELELQRLNRIAQQENDLICPSCGCTACTIDPENYLCPGSSDRTCPSCGIVWRWDGQDRKKVGSLHKMSLPAANWPLYRLLQETGLAVSGSEAKRLTMQGAVKVDGKTWEIPSQCVNLEEGGQVTVRVGKTKVKTVMGEKLNW